MGRSSGLCNSRRFNSTQPLKPHILSSEDYIVNRITFLFCLLALCLFATCQPATAQGYLTATDNPSFSVNIPVENRFIKVANGNLHMEFPLATHKQRGALALDEKIVYDSRIWMIGHYNNYY
jgi:hypothetical protein